MILPSFKDPSLEDQWNGKPLVDGGPTFSPMLKSIVQTEVDVFGPLGWIPTITSIIRTPEQNDALYGGKGTHLDGVHVEGRGIDIRYPYSGSFGLTLVGRVNDLWIYDPERPELKCAIIEDVSPTGSSAKHIHLQVCSNTVSRQQTLQGVDA